jgi:hypothetical protein
MIWGGGGAGDKVLLGENILMAKTYSSWSDKRKSVLLNSQYVTSLAVCIFIDRNVTISKRLTVM